MSARILVVDDHAGTLDIISMTLQRQGYEVYAARSGSEALVLAETEKPELILLDVMMPDMDGLEVCRRLRKMDVTTNTPIIMFTAMSRAEDKLAGFAAGANDYLSKPTRPNELLRRVRAILSRSGTTGSLANKKSTASVGVQASIRAPEPAIPAPPSLEPAQSAQITTVNPPVEREPARVVTPPPVSTDLSSNQEHVIAVVGVCGGTGTTTTAINLAVSMADEGRSTALIDLDMAQGHIALHLGWKKPGGVNTLVQLTDAAWQKKLDEQLIVYGNQLKLLLAQPNMANDLPTLSPEEASKLIESVRGPGHCVVADVGRGLNPISQAVLAHATDLVICMRPDRVAILAAKQLLQYVKEQLSDQITVHMLLLSFTGRSNFPLPVIEDFVGHPIADELVIEAHTVTRAVNKGLPLVRINENSDISQQFHELARRVVRRPR